MILNRFILIISSFFVATNALCPTWWWPMSAASPSVGFFSEVMRGNNIIAMPGLAAAVTITTYSANDRMASGKNYKSLSLTAAQFIVLPADTYFCNGAFTISLFIKPSDLSTNAATIASFTDVAGTNSVIFGLPLLMTTLTLAVSGNTVSTSGTLATTLNTAAGWSFVAVSYTGSGQTPNFYVSTVASNAQPPAVPGGTIPTAPTCTTMIINHIGATAATASAAVNLPLQVASINDFKIYNFGLSTTQIQTRYLAEVGKLLKINFLYFRG